MADPVKQPAHPYWGGLSVRPNGQPNPPGQPALLFRNLTARPEVSIVVFDSSVPIGTGKCVYMSAAGEMVTGDEREEGIQLFSRRSVGHGGREWTLEDVESPASLRLYRATAVDLYVLDEHDERVHVKGL